MTEKIRVELDNQTADGLDDIRKDLRAAGDAADHLADELKKVDHAEEQLGDGGKAGGGGFGGLGGNIISANQALELFKKGIEAASRVVNALADDGSPAFTALRDSVSGVHDALLDLADDPAVQEFAGGLADQINGSLIPAIANIPQALRESEAGWKLMITQAKEALGLVEKGTLKQAALKELAAIKEAEQQKEINALARQKAEVEKKLGDIESAIAQKSEVAAIQRMSSERQLQDILSDEMDQLKELQTQGRSTRAEQERSLQKITALHERLAELPGEEAAAAIRSQEEVTRDRLAAQQKVNEDAAKMTELARQNAMEEARAVAEAEEIKRQEREKTLQAQQDALLKSGGGAVSRARASLDPRAVREQVARQRQAEAAAAGGGEREIRDARRQAFNLFNRGGIGGEEIGRAQNALLEGQIQQAQKRGLVDSEHASLLGKVVNAQQNSAAQQEVFAQQLAQLNAAMSNVGRVQSGTRQRYQAAALGR